MRAGVARAGRGRHGGYRSAVCSREEIRTFARQPGAGEGGPRVPDSSLAEYFPFETLRVPDHTVCRFAVNAVIPLVFCRGRCAAASHSAFFNGKMRQRRAGERLELGGRGRERLFSRRSKTTMPCRDAGRRGHRQRDEGYATPQTGNGQGQQAGKVPAALRAIHGAAGGAVGGYREAPSVRASLRAGCPATAPASKTPPASTCPQSRQWRKPSRAW